jgi:putative DNA primase/helicase
VDATDLPPYSIEELLKGLPELPEEKPRQYGNGHGHHQGQGATFWQAINAAALGQLDRWVCDLFPTARFQAGTRAYRVSSKDLGRSLEEDLSLAPEGIRDFGREVGLTAIETVLQFGTARTPRDAALWLCARIGVDLESLGWRGDAPRGNSQDNKARAPKLNGAGQQWPEPHPLPDSLLPVACFDFDLIPEQARPWIVDVCERMQCPPDYVAVSLMAALGSMVGRKIAIRPQIENDWEVIPNQWALLIGRPGVLKSPAMEEVLKPLHRLSAIALEKLKREMTTYEALATVAKLRHKDNMEKASKILRKNRDADVTSLFEGEEQASEPTLKRYIANDTNVASLGVLLQQNPNGLLVFRDEIVSLLDNLDREEFASERGFYLTGWSGNSSYTFDRIGRGLHLSIDGVCISMLGSTQPGRIEQYLARAMRGGRGDDGLIQRFGLMVWPDISRDWKHVDRRPDRDAKLLAMNVFERLDGLDWRAINAKRDRGPDGDEEGLPHLRFGIDAYDLFQDWRSALERRLRSGELHVALEAHLAKYRKLVPGLSLISHLADGLTGPVCVASVRRALAWVDYLESHARRAYGSVTAASADTANAILSKLRSGHLKAPFGSRDVWRPGWSKLTDREAVDAGLRILVEYDWLGQQRVETPGRPATVYCLNPNAKL